MARTGVTYEQVKDVAELLLKSGETPTIEKCDSNSEEPAAIPHSADTSNSGVQKHLRYLI